MENTNIKIDCPCKRIKCERHGNCAACREHHLTKKNSLVACERIKEKEEKKLLKKLRKENRRGENK